MAVNLHARSLAELSYAVAAEHFFLDRRPPSPE
jgi:hypothetical protein